MRAVYWLAMCLQAQRGALFPWTPVCLGIGIALYFAQAREPSTTVLWTAAAGAGLLLFLAWRAPGTARAIQMAALALCAGGFALGGWRAHDVAAPVLGWRYYGPVEGRVVELDRSASDAVRVTLDQVRLARVAPHEMPARVRISLHGDAAEGPEPVPGARVMTTAHLSPPGGPVEPGGFDFQRHSWFLQLGGVGYTRVPLMQAGPPEATGAGMQVFRLRMAVSQHVRAVLPGDIGGFAAAVTAGDRSGMGQDALDALRASNLAHLLAISGLHMGLLTGFVFAVLRFGLVLIPSVALTWPTRGVAAFVALVAGAGYLALSGGNVATERAFVMAAVALCAVMLNRRAISLRSVAIAALVVLVLRPEALLGPGFQMSFAATAALVAVFNAMRDAPWRMPRWLKPVSAVVLSSGVAGLATAPYAAAHFNAIAHYGLLANILSVPVMGTVVVPAAVLAVCLAPLGLSDLGLQLMGLGLRWILMVAETTAGLPGARSFVVSPGAWVLPCLTLGAMMVILWRGRGRLLGVLPVAAAFAIWAGQPRPDLLIADTGALVGVMTEDGRALSRARGSGFVAQNWLENDGDGVDQARANARWTAQWPEQESARITAGALAAWPVLHLTGKTAAASPPDCRGGILVANEKLDLRTVECLIFDPVTLRATGAVALSQRKGGRLTITTARQIAGDRLWSQWPERRADLQTRPARSAPASAADQYVRMSPTSRP